MATAAIRPLTSRTRVALAIARAIAAGRGEGNVSPTHVVLGILGEGANPGVAALWQKGLAPNDLHRLRAELQESLGRPHGRSEPRLVALDLTPGEELVVQAAEAEADLLNDDHLDTAHLLLGILRDTSGVPATLLAAQGVSVEAFQDGISRVRRGDRPL